MFKRSTRFWKLIREREERGLSVAENLFVDRYLARHPQVAEELEAESLALNLLRGQALEHEPSDSFESVILRKYRISSVRRSLSYWSPALVGGSIAAIAALAILQVMMHSRTHREIFRPGDSEARNVSTPLSFPREGSLNR